MQARPGFTLVEVVVALAVSGLVVLLAHQVLASVTATATSVEAEQRRIDREANARRLLTQLFANLDMGADDGGGYVGRSAWTEEVERDELRFDTWVQTTGGWFTRSGVALAVVEGQFVALVRDVPMVLADSVTALGFDHLARFGADAPWVSQWVSRTSAPPAVRVRVQRGSIVDTALYYIGTRS